MRSIPARRAHWLLALMCWLFGCGSHAPITPARHGVCFMAAERGTAAQPVRAQDWLKLLVKLELGPEAIVALRDCTGRPIREPPDVACRQAREPGALPSPMPIRQASVIERTLAGGRQLLWVVSHRLPSGEGLGPLALTRRTVHGLEVESLGSLSMRTERVKLELWQVRGEAVVMASGEVCRAPQLAAASGEPQLCRRVGRLFVQRQSSLAEAPVLDSTGRCAEATPLELDRRQQLPIAGGLKRNFELTTTLRHDPRQIVLEEQLVVRDSDPNLPLSAAREVQRIEATRFIRVSGGRLWSQQRPLWSQALPQLLPALPANNPEPDTARRAMNQR